MQTPRAGIARDLVGPKRSEKLPTSGAAKRALKLLIPVRVERVFGFWALCYIIYMAVSETEEGSTEQRLF